MQKYTAIISPMFANTSPPTQQNNQCLLNKTAVFQRVGS